MGSARTPGSAGSSGGAGARWRLRRQRFALALGILVTTSGCYSHVPYGGPTSTPTGAVLLLDLNDRGRAALGDSIGPSASQIEGRLRSASDSVLELSVLSVRYYGGRANQWSGEPLNVRADFVGRAQERRFSRTRTWLVAAAAVAAVVVLSLATDLFTGGGLVPEDPGGGPGNGQ